MLQVEIGDSISLSSIVATHRRRGGLRERGERERDFETERDLRDDFLRSGDGDLDTEREREWRSLVTSVCSLGASALW